MNSNRVGAGILNIVTESLYDKPIVVFREYVQNSVDSFLKLQGKVEKDQLRIMIWVEGNDLFFLDNGAGIEPADFYLQMTSIAWSQKTKTANLGYKGIGRLSGVPYCRELEFINICDYDEKIFQKYVISNLKYNALKEKREYGQMDFADLMEQIGSFQGEMEIEDKETILETLEKHRELFTVQKTGFMVRLRDFNTILKSTMKETDFIKELEWLLPVKFKDELLKGKARELFEEITEKQGQICVPAESFPIIFNERTLERPIRESMLRDYLCKRDLSYGVCIHCFKRDKISISKLNDFSGVRVYIDNMLLCDETELLPMLQQYGLIQHTANELIQSVKGIGAMIYITDKVNISANARRTFIEVTDQSSLEFLENIAEFIEDVYETRYALSKYQSAKKHIEDKTVNLDNLKEEANESLQKLAREVIDVAEKEDEGTDIEKLSATEQKQMIKRKIVKEINSKIRIYVAQTDTFDYENAYEDFKLWLSSN